MTDWEQAVNQLKNMNPQLEYPNRVDLLDTRNESRVFITSDDHIGVWLKFGPLDALEWENVLQYAECVPDGYNPDDWDDEDEWYWTWLHNQAAHWALMKMVPWLKTMRIAYPELGWDEALLSDPPEHGPESR